MADPKRKGANAKMRSTLCTADKVWIRTFNPHVRNEKLRTWGWLLTEDLKPA